LKRFPVFIAIFLLIMFCEDTEQHSQNFTNKDSVSFETGFTVPSLDSKFLEELYAYQMKILLNPDDNSSKAEFISKAYIKEKNVLITFGNAKKINPKTGEQISPALIKRAAILDAKRWAAYGINWIKNGTEIQFGKINEIYQGLNKEIYTFQKGDSLIVTLASKVQ